MSDGYFRTLYEEYWKILRVIRKVIGVLFVLGGIAHTGYAILAMLFPTRVPFEFNGHSTFGYKVLWLMIALVPIALGIVLVVPPQFKAPKH